MTNEDRLPPREYFDEEFGQGFITDTYSGVRDSDGYKHVLPNSLNNITAEGEAWATGAKAGSVTAQYVELVWSMHENDFWEWRLGEW